MPLGSIQILGRMFHIDSIVRRLSEATIMPLGSIWILGRKFL